MRNDASATPGQRRTLGIIGKSGELLTLVDVAPPAPVEGPAAELDREALAALPAALRTELADAVVSLDPARISGWIRRVTGTNPELGAALEQHASRFRYTAILHALQSIGRDAAAANGDG
jgi:hypothetical protein